MEGAFLSCHIIILPVDVISPLKRAATLVVTCVCLQRTWRVLSCRMIILPSDIIFALVVTCVCRAACRYFVLKVVRYNKTIVALE